MTRAILLAAVLIAAAPAAALAKSKTVEQAGTITAVALPVIAGGVTAMKHDWNGTAQLVIDTGLTVGAAFALKQVVHEKRPDGSDFKSFPSDTAALAFAPAQFLWDRYGWQYGVPAYVAAGFVGYSRVDAKKHHWYDVAASAAISFGVSKIFTTTYHGPLRVEFGATPDSASMHLGYRW